MQSFLPESVALQEQFMYARFRTQVNAMLTISCLSFKTTWRATPLATCLCAASQCALSGTVMHDIGFRTSVLVIKGWFRMLACETTPKIQGHLSWSLQGNPACPHANMGLSRKGRNLGRFRMLACENGSHSHASKLRAISHASMLEWVCFAPIKIKGDFKLCQPIILQETRRRCGMIQKSFCELTTK